MLDVTPGLQFGDPCLRVLPWLLLPTRDMIESCVSGLVTLLVSHSAHPLRLYGSKRSSHQLVISKNSLPTKRAEGVLPNAIERTSSPFALGASFPYSLIQKK